MSAQSPIERAARALCELEGNPPGATMDGKPLWRDYVPEVRAVLTAIRDPSVDMNYRGCLNHPPADTAGIWRAMIDAALAEG